MADHPAPQQPPPKMPAPQWQPQHGLRFQRQARSWKLGLALAGWIIVLIAGGIWAQVSPWGLGLLALPCLPGLWELWRNPSSGLRIDATTLRWHIAQKRAEVALGDISHLRLDRRLDLSYRATLVLHTGTKLRLPPPVLPPRCTAGSQLETCLAAHGIPCQRHPFSIL